MYHTIYNGDGEKKNILLHYEEHEIELNALNYLHRLINCLREIKAQKFLMKSLNKEDYKTYRKIKVGDINWMREK